jgi:sulfur carrier protein ThiS
MTAVLVRMHGNLRRFLPGGEACARLTLPPGTTVQDFVASIGAQHDVWMVAINGTVAPFGTEIGDGDELDCFEPLEGG